MPRAARSFALALALVLLVSASPVIAQWSRVTEPPASDIFSVFTNGDTIIAGADTALYISTNHGATWKRSARVAAGVTSVQAGVVRNGRIYAATFGQGVFVSDDLGDTWLGFNQASSAGSRTPSSSSSSCSSTATAFTRRPRGPASTCATWRGRAGANSARSSSPTRRRT